MTTGDLQLQVTQPVASTEESRWAHLRIVTPEANGDAQTNKVHIIFVVDVSGSMGSVVESTDASGAKESHGFSILDLVKHALLTIVNSLDESHIVSLIAFTDNATTEFSELVMTPAGVKEAETAIKALAPLCSTNLWSGLKSAFDMVKSVQQKFPDDRYYNEVMLFTDGMPNREPPQGHIPTIEKYLETHEIPSELFTLRTFGFGYSLDSKLCEQIAVLGRGSFSFIPDASFVGTVFIHACADILTRHGAVRGAKLVLRQGKNESGQPMNALVGWDSHKHLGWKKRTRALPGADVTAKAVPCVEVPLSTLGLGTTYDFVVRNPDFSLCQLEYLQYDPSAKVVADDSGDNTAGTGAGNDTSRSAADDFTDYNVLPCTDNDDTNENNAQQKVAKKNSPWVLKALVARDAVSTQAEEETLTTKFAQVQFARAQTADLLRHLLDGPLKSKKQLEEEAATANSGGYRGFVNARITDEALKAKQRLLRDFLEKASQEFARLRSSVYGSSAVNVVANTGAPVNGAAGAESVAHSFDIVDFESQSVRSPAANPEPASEPTVSLAEALGGGGIDDDEFEEEEEEDMALRMFEGLLKDLRGQMTEALEKTDAWERWGIYYARSLQFAHQHFRRNNFKDFGVLCYGGKEFDKEVGRIGDVFDVLAPPEPSNTHGKTNYHRPTSMAVYNNCYGGCFLPECSIAMADGSFARAADVRAGDLVKTGVSADARVLCVIKIVSGKSMVCVRFNDSGLALTPWHPMLDVRSSQWVFPAELSSELNAQKPNSAHKVETPVVYNFLLESAAAAASNRTDLESVARSTDELTQAGRHSVVVNGVPCVTFGHGLTVNSVVRHEYFGNMRKILRDVFTMEGWADGRVLLRSETACVKDPSTNLTTKMVQDLGEFQAVGNDTEMNAGTASSCADLTDGCRLLRASSSGKNNTTAKPASGDTSCVDAQYGGGASSCAAELHERVGTTPNHMEVSPSRN